MNATAALARQLENLLRFGTIAEVQYQPPRVRVRSGNLLTAWLPWLALRAGDSQSWDPPTVDEQCLLLSPSGHTGNGVALVGLPSDQHPANGDRPGLHRRTYPDGAVIEYDSAAHRLRATLPDGGITDLISSGGINITGPIHHQGDYTQKGNYTQQGDQAITGQVTASVDVIAAGVSLVKHEHTGNLGRPTSPPL